jgi:hypothetical protein
MSLPEAPSFNNPESRQQLRDIIEKDGEEELNRRNRRLRLLPPPPVDTAEWSILFDKIGSTEDNEDEICTFLDSYSAAEIQINKPIPCYTGAETMLMWAVWRQKSKVVRKLIERGGDVQYMNETGQGISTYWDYEKIREDEDTACEIAKILHHAGADLGCAYGMSWSIVQKAREYGFRKLRAVLEELDEYYKTMEFIDEST